MQFLMAVNKLFDSHHSKGHTPGIFLGPKLTAMQLTVEVPRMKVYEELERQLQADFEYLVKVYCQVLYCDLVMREAQEAHSEHCLICAQLLLPGRLICFEAQAHSFECALYKVINGLERELYRSRTDNRYNYQFMQKRSSCRNAYL
jgi:hypothetical protein